MKVEKLLEISRIKQLAKQKGIVKISGRRETILLTRKKKLRKTTIHIFKE